MPHDWLWYIVISNISLCLFTEFSHLAEPESSARRWWSGFIRDSSRLWITWTGKKMQCQSNIHQGLTIKSASTSHKANHEAYRKWCLDPFVLHTFSQPWIMCDPSYRACHGLPAIWEAHNTTICAWPENIEKLEHERAIYISMQSSQVSRIISSEWFTFTLEISVYIQLHLPHFAYLVLSF